MEIHPWSASMMGSMVIIFYFKRFNHHGLTNEAEDIKILLLKNQNA